MLPNIQSAKEIGIITRPIRIGLRKKVLGTNFVCSNLFILGKKYALFPKTER
jgi:hypothetical protein